MNEPESFVHGNGGSCTSNKYDNPPYNPLGKQPLYENTLCMNNNAGGTLTYNMHSLYAHFESKATRVCDV